MSRDYRNSTSQQGFYILAFSRIAEVQIILFILVLLMYLLSMVGNLVLSGLVCISPQLHTPMYFLLCNLSFQDIIYVSAILPKLLAITITGDTWISFSGCITQMFMFVFCLDTEFFMLTTMAYDRYVAICIPLRYTLVMNKKVCCLMASSCWVVGGLNAMMHSILMSNLSFCDSQEINHFFCEIKTMLNLSSSDTSKIILLIFIEGVFIGCFPFVLIMTSYIFIISTILKIRTSSRRQKTFSSCSSHLTIVMLLYGTSLGFYMKSDSENSQEQDKVLSLLYIAVVPMLNPLVYSLRNKVVLRAMRKVFKHADYQ
ncbi:olfactory receptor 5V1-like [Spea bombifrons]|uniref:olfactory receptor 5V1-like n=1 Tax=Spea bombifrons TaxID=233779 RepID=UPI00234AA012|nr:olfactory receptor 5V1-like [Spea bombifrons]